MGLDSVEFIISVEDAFGLDIADRDAERMRTPRDVINHLAAQLPASAAVGRVGPHCLSQRAFYFVRAAAATHFDRPRSALGPGLPLRDLVPGPQRKEAWSSLRASLGATRWPAYAEPGFWSRGGGIFAERPTNLGGVARYLADYQPRLVRGWDTPWTWYEIAAAVDRLMREELGIAKYTLDSSFIRDLGVR
jgi:hypothetical protein